MSAEDSDEKLPQLLQTLPQELFDRIYDEVFTAPSGIRKIAHKTTTTAAPGPEHDEIQCQIVNLKRHGIVGRDLANNYGVMELKDFNPQIRDPNIHLLHIDRVSRQKFAATFFGGKNLFWVFDDTWCPANFVQTLEAQQMDMIRAGLLEKRTEAEDLAIPEDCIRTWVPSQSDDESVYHTDYSDDLEDYEECDDDDDDDEVRR